MYRIARTLLKKKNYKRNMFLYHMLTWIMKLKFIHSTKYIECLFWARCNWRGGQVLGRSRKHRESFSSPRHPGVVTQKAPAPHEEAAAEQKSQHQFLSHLGHDEPSNKQGRGCIISLDLTSKSAWLWLHTASKPHGTQTTVGGESGSPWGGAEAGF